MAKQKFRDPRGLHLRVYHDLMNSPAYRVLSTSAKALYFDMRAKLNGSNNGNLEATLDTLRHRGWKHGSTIAGALYELQTMGFLIRTRPGSYAIGKGQCALYAFTDLDVFEQKGKCEASKATNDYRTFESVAVAERALADGVARLRSFARQLDAERKEIANAKKIAQIKNCTELSAKTALNGARFSAKTDLGANFSVQKLSRTKARKSARKTLKDKRFRPSHQCKP